MIRVSALLAVAGFATLVTTGLWVLGLAAVVFAVAGQTVVASILLGTLLDLLPSALGALGLAGVAAFVIVFLTHPDSPESVGQSPGQSLERNGAERAMRSGH